MFYTFGKHIKKNSYNSNYTIRDHFAKVKNPTTNRSGKDNKYYVEMQLMAFQLMRYLKMNDDSNEHSRQGSWNWTYFVENLVDGDMQLLIELINGGLYVGDTQASLMESEDIGDSYMRVIYKPKGSEEIRRIVKKVDMKKAIEEINSRIEIDYLKTELVEYKEDKRERT